MDINNIISVISTIRNQANEFIINELKREGFPDLSPSHGFILYNLFKKDGLTMKEINEKINKKKNTVTVLIEKLILLNYVRKEDDADDKRITRIYLTEKGKSFENSFNEISIKLLKKSYENFNDEEIKNIMSLLNKIKKNFS